MIYLGIIIGVALTLFVIAGLCIRFYKEVEAEIEAEADFQYKLHDELISARGEVEDLRNEVGALVNEGILLKQELTKAKEFKSLQCESFEVAKALLKAEIKALQAQLANPPHVSSVEVAAGVVVDLDEARKGMRSRNRETMKQKIAAITPQIAEKVEDQDDA